MTIQTSTLNTDLHFVLWESTLVPNPLESWFKNSSLLFEDLTELLPNPMLAAIKTTAAEERDAVELHSTMLSLLAVYSCT